MRVLIVSHQYYPVLGGVLVVARLLAQGFLELNAAVRLVTATPTTSQENDPFDVYRRPSPLFLLKLFRWAGQIVMIGPSVRSGWPVFFSRKPCVISHQAGVPVGKLQWALIKKSKNIACSQYLADGIGGDTISVANPFDPSNFCADKSVPKERDFIFVGRLVPDKGSDIFLRALADLRKRGIAVRASIVGAGGEKQTLEKLATELGVADMVVFTGPLHGAELQSTIQRHRIGIIPSRWQEPFGIVALELIACGLPVIAARVGGLPEAVGPCGLLFKNEDYRELSSKMEYLFLDRKLQHRLLSKAQAHLGKSSPKNVAKAYLNVLAGCSVGRQILADK